MTIPTLDFNGSTPVVTIPQGFQVSKFFKLEKKYHFKVNNLLQDGDGNTKLRKNKKRGFKTVGLNLAPAKLAMVGNTCPASTKGCRESCLDNCGLRAVFTSIHMGKIARTVLWFKDRKRFLEMLDDELERKRYSAERAGDRLAARLNVFSDIPFEKHGVMDRHPEIEFYDYTKRPKRFGQVRPNYWVTLSRSENNETQCLYALSQGANVAVVFASIEGKQFTTLPKTWKGFPVVVGDESDLRFQDPRGRTRGRVVGLELKAPNNQLYQKAIDSGFALPVA
tara:strand:+ start:3474 stop:4313 length:840 start_codon:yes stop_codon:yes gene_type:complete